MKTHRFIGDFKPDGDYLELKDEELLNQIKNVLKLKPGEKIVLADGHGEEMLAVIKSFHLKFIALTILQKNQNINDPKTSVILYCAVLKSEKFEWLAEKATEVGVRRIVPVISDRTVKLNLKLDRIRKIVKEASEQSGRAVLPEIGEIVSLKDAVLEARDNEANLFFDPSGKALERPRWFGMYGGQKAGVFIGPEGGWTEKELGTAQENNFQIVSLGKLVLRAETAAIIAVYLAAH